MLFYSTDMAHFKILREYKLLELECQTPVNFRHPVIINRYYFNASSTDVIIQIFLARLALSFLMRMSLFSLNGCYKWNKLATLNILVCATKPCHR